MLRNKRIRGTLITSLVGILIATTIVLVWGALVFSVTFLAKSVTCNLSGTYTRELHQDGSTTWSPSEPSSATITASGRVWGLGKAAVEVASGNVGFTSGNVGGKSVSSSKNGERIGTWAAYVVYIPYWQQAYKTFSTSSDVAGLSTTDNTYYWTATGKFYTTWIRFMYGWNDEPEDHTPVDADGSWTVKTEKVCPACKKYVNSFTQHQQTCPGCGTTYYTCTSQRVLAANSIAETDGWGRHWQGRCVDSTSIRDRNGNTIRGCGARIWACNNGIHGLSKCASCKDWKRDCMTHVCPNGGTVRNNRGGTIGGGGGSDSYVACPAGSSCSRGGRVSMPSAHKRRSNSGCGHRFYECIDGEGPKHRLRTCSRCNTRYTQCGNWGPCRHNGRTYVYHN